MRGDSAAVGFGALDGAAEAQGLAVAGGQRAHHVAVDRDVLRVVARGVVELVCGVSVHTAARMEGRKQDSQCMVI